MSLNLPLTVGGERYREEAAYRYSVRCDRTMARWIEDAAKKAGMTANAFVQQHFETIRDKAKPSAAAPAFRATPDARAIEACATRHDLSKMTARVLLTLSGHADAEMAVRRSLPQIGADVGLPTGTVVKHVNRLRKRGLLERLSDSTGKTAVYRVWAGDA